MCAISLAVPRFSRSVIAASSSGASGRRWKSCTHRIRTPPSTSAYSQRMRMYSNGPVSTRRARTVLLAGSAMRSDTQLHTWPFSSGRNVSRKRTVSPSRPRTSTAAYSLNSSGQDATSLVISQTRSIGAPMTTLLSMWPAISHQLPSSVDVVEQQAGGGQPADRVVGDRQPVLGADPPDSVQHDQRVVPQLGERHVQAVPVRCRGLVVARALAQDPAKVRQRELCHVPPPSIGSQWMVRSTTAALKPP